MRGLVDWDYAGRTFSSVPDGAFGFIYEVVFEDGFRYIGRKHFFNNTVKPVSLKEFNDSPKGTFKKKKINGRMQPYIECKKESNWINYCGSSDIIKQKMNHGHKLSRRTILHITYNLRDTTYYETKELFSKSVLERREYLNKNILGRFFKKTD